MKQKNAKDRKTLCKLYILDVNKTPAMTYGCIRVGWDYICRNGVKLKKSYYTTYNCEYEYEVNPEELFRISNLSNRRYRGPSLSVGDVIEICNGKNKGIWFINDIGFIKFDKIKEEFQLECQKKITQ